MTIPENTFCQSGITVIETELAAIASLRDRIDENFATACQYLLHCQGRVIVTGMGKSGHIANKAAATFASTGTPSFFVHPAEANHGDMGMITQKDVVLAISNSGNTNEILMILPLIRQLNIPLISMTGNPNSKLAKESLVHLNVSVEKEACPLGLAPTSSTTASLVIGDALAIALLKARGFTKKDFAMAHPGGALGRRLLLHVSDIMRTGNLVPQVHETATVDTALIEMTQKNLGFTAVVKEDNSITGIFTDGDLRRTLKNGHPIRTTKIKEVMTHDYKKAPLNMLAVEALAIMESFRITNLLVINEHNNLVGALHMHDLLTAGVI